MNFLIICYLDVYLLISLIPDFIIVISTAAISWFYPFPFIQLTSSQPMPHFPHLYSHDDHHHCYCFIHSDLCSDYYYWLRLIVCVLWEACTWRCISQPNLSRNYLQILENALLSYQMWLSRSWSHCSLDAHFNNSPFFVCFIDYFKEILYERFSVWLFVKKLRVVF